jgi:hypothetical protein
MKLYLKIFFLLILLSGIFVSVIKPQEVFFKVKFKRSDGSEKYVYRLKKGDILYIEHDPLIPFMYRGGNPVTWYVDPEGRIIINRRTAGFILDDRNLGLLPENRDAEFFIWHNKNSLPQSVLKFIAENNARKIFLSLQGYDGPGEDIGNLSLLNEKLIFLSLRDSTFSRIGKNAGLTYLNGLDLYNSRMNEDEILRLIGDNQIVRLNLGKTSITGAGLLELTKLAALKNLDLSSTLLDDKSLEWIKFFRHLEVLDVSQTKISDHFLEKLENTITLQEISLNDTTISDRGIAYLKDLAFLKKMNLSGIKFGENPSGLSYLSNMARLQIIILKNAQINKKVLDCVSKCQMLRVLDITATGVNDSDLANLPELTMLDELYCGENPLTGDAVRYIKDIQNLKVLDMTATDVSGPQQEYFKRMEGLQILYVAGTGFDDDGMTFIKNLPNLVEVDLSNTQVTKKCIPDILKMQSLRRIFLTGSKFSPADIKSLKTQSPVLEVYYEE